MYNSEIDRYSKVFTSSLNEELGQIKFVFSDKTGTLTCNKMEFKICVIGDEVYGDTTCLEDGFLSMHTSRIIDKAAGALVDEDKFEAEGFQEKKFAHLKHHLPDNKNINCDLYDSTTYTLAHKIKTQYDLVKEYFLLLSLCHDCVVEEDQNGTRYQGESPDEIALVKTASQVGFRYVCRYHKMKRVFVLGVDTLVEELAFFPFDSDRKRASIIIRHEGKIKVMMKGADFVIFDRLMSQDIAPQPYLKIMKKKLETFSRKGLRTLCMAVRVITEAEWSIIEQLIEESCSDPNEKKKFILAAELAEKDMTLIGCSAVEDKLQDEVPETIRDLLMADINVWMLTGDKLETAENVGYSCKLIQDDFQKMYIYGTDNLLTKYNECSNKIKELKKNGIKTTLLVEGNAITRLLKEKELKDKIINDVMTKCDSVICCRVSPKEKADVVRLVKNNLNELTLAIGDGANDVNMI